MAVHVPDKMVYRSRYRSWADGICPYCGKTIPNITKIEKRTKNGKLVGEHFECTSCNACNFFSNKNILEE